MNKLFFGLLLQAAFYSGNLYAQTDLRTDAYSIIQDAVTDIVCSSSTDAIQKEKRVIQVLNEKGKEKVWHDVFVYMKEKKMPPLSVCATVFPL